MNAFFAWIAENRAMLVPPVFGFLALYLLLPREYRFWRPIGIAFGVVALGVLGYLFSVPGMSLSYKVLSSIFNAFRAWQNASSPPFSRSTINRRRSTS